MLRIRVAAVVFGTALALGGAAAAAGAQSGGPPSGGSSETETPIAASGGPVTITVAGVGTVTLTVDPNTGAISNVVVTPIDGVTAGAPVVTDEGVKVQLTAADGTIRVLEISAQHDDGGIVVETQVEVQDPEDASGPAGEDQQNGPGDQHADHPEETLPPTSPAPSSDHSDADHSGGSDHSGGESGGD